MIILGSIYHRKKAKQKMKYLSAPANNTDMNIPGNPGYATSSIMNLGRSLKLEKESGYFRAIEINISAANFWLQHNQF